MDLSWHGFGSLITVCGRVLPKPMMDCLAGADSPKAGHVSFALKKLPAYVLLV